MTPTDLLGFFRDEMADTATPYLWSDAFVYNAINEAQNWFCRLTEGLEDSRTPGATQLLVTPNVEWYATSPLILKLRKANRGDTGRRVDIINAEKADELGYRFDGRTAGPVRALVTGLERHAVRAWPIPTETVTLNLSIFRLPLTPITGPAQALEIDGQHHYSLLMWVKSLAYGKQDSEAFNRDKSKELAEAFQAYCAQARREQERARRETGTVMYGGL